MKGNRLLETLNRLAIMQATTRKEKETKVAKVQAGSSYDISCISDALIA